MTGKTKAAMPGRLSLNALLKHRQITRLAAGGQSLTAYGVSVASIFKRCANPTISKLVGCLPNIVVLVEVTNNRVANSQLTAPLAHPPISPVLGKTQGRDYAYHYPVIGYRFLLTVVEQFFYPFETGQQDIWFRVDFITKFAVLDMHIIISRSEYSITDWISVVC